MYANDTPLCAPLTAARFSGVAARLAGIILAGLVALGCSPDDEQPEAAPTLTELNTQIFQNTCAISGCHVGTSPRGGLLLANDLHANLVGVAAEGAPNRVRVVAGDPDASYIIEKLASESPAAGTQMPPTNPKLTADQIDLIRAWIAAGAKND